MGLLRGAFYAVVVVVFLAALSGAYAYATDYGVTGSVTDKQRSSGGQDGVVVLTLSLVPYSVEQKVDLKTFCVLEIGNYVVYHVQTGRTLVYDHKGGRLYYDTGAGGLVVPPSVNCA